MNVPKIRSHAINDIIKKNPCKHEKQKRKDLEFIIKNFEKDSYFQFTNGEISLMQLELRVFNNMNGTNYICKDDLKEKAEKVATNMPVNVLRKTERI